MTTIRQQGLRELFRHVKRRMIRSDIERAIRDKSYGVEASALATALDFSSRDVEQSLRRTQAAIGELAIRSIAWYLPGFSHAFYGGMQTILRFAAQFLEKHGVRNTFIIADPSGGPSAEDYRLRIAAAFPSLANCACIVFGPREQAAAPTADAAIATFWTTAYLVLANNHVARKFYFLQDFEPLFYPAGSISAQVEATYRFGFHAIANTVGLKSIYEQEFGGVATSFNPCVNTHLFYPRQEARPETDAFKIFFYARPSTPRNGFEIGAAALRKVKERLGDQVEIICAGEQWDQASYGLEGTVSNLGFLTYQQTADLYRNCDVGLAMMFTRHPSYLPFELMASGCLVVANQNNSTSWFLKHGVNCLLAASSASCISERIVEALQDRQRRKTITETAHTQIETQFSNWEAQIDSVFFEMQRPARI